MKYGGYGGSVCEEIELTSDESSAKSSFSARTATATSRHPLFVGSLQISA